MSQCVLEPGKICNGCGSCNICDLDETKVCDNCCRCLEEADYRAISIDKILMPEPVRMKWKRGAVPKDRQAATKPGHSR